MGRETELEGELERLVLGMASASELGRVGRSGRVEGREPHRSLDRIGTNLTPPMHVRRIGCSWEARKCAGTGLGEVASFKRRQVPQALRPELRRRNDKLPVGRGRVVPVGFVAVGVRAVRVWGRAERDGRGCP